MLVDLLPSVLYALLLISLRRKVAAQEKDIEGWRRRFPSDFYDIEYTLSNEKESWKQANNICKTGNAELLCHDTKELSTLSKELPILEDRSVWLGSYCGKPEIKCMIYSFETGKSNKDCGKSRNFICRREIKKKGDVWCPGMIQWGIRWPSTPGGQKVERLCPNSSLVTSNQDAPTGSSSWLCNSITGQWSPESPNVEHCVSSGIDWPTFMTNVWERNVTESSQNLIKLVYKSKYPGDIVRAVDGITKILDRTGSLDHAEFKTSFPVVGEDIIIAADVLIDRKPAWIQLDEFQRVRQVDELMSQVERAGFALSKVDDQPNRILKRKNIIMQVLKNVASWDRLSFPDMSCWNTTNGTFAQITLPPLLNHPDKDDRVVFTWYDGLVDVLPNEAQSLRNRSLNSAIVGATIPESASMNFSEYPVQILLKHKIPGAKNPICVYWVPYWNIWNSDGCQVFETNDTHTLCVCDHLTNFAVLMDVSCSTCRLSKAHKISLRIISVIGCCISVLFLFVTVVILCHFRTLRNIKNTIHKNLSVCLLIGDIALLVGMDRTETKIGCGVAAALIQYFFLSAFCWMLLEAIHIQLLLTKVFQPKHNYTKRYYCFGYGVPLIVLIPTVGFRYEDYGTTEFCWLSPNRGTIWSFIGPVAVVLFYNVVTLGMALWISHTCGQSKLDEQLEAAKLWARRSAVLLPILGVTWGLGFLYVEESMVGWAYAFACLNSLQGLGIFVFHVALRPEVKVALTRWWKVRNLSKTPHKEPLRSADSNS